jgi:hypothetical protein
MSKTALIESLKAQAMQQQADTLVDLKQQLNRIEEKIDALLSNKTVTSKARAEKADKPST